MQRLNLSERIGFLPDPCKAETPRSERNPGLQVPCRSMSNLAITYDDVVAADRHIAGAAHRTPALTSATANDVAGASLFFKCENFQRMGAFKFRGAHNAIAQFSPRQRKAGVISYSSGNHAQAIALSARLQGINSVIVMPSDAPAIKIAATRGYGSEVIFYDRLSEDREALRTPPRGGTRPHLDSTLRPSARNGRSGHCSQRIV